MGARRYARDRKTAATYCTSVFLQRASCSAREVLVPMCCLRITLPQTPRTYRVHRYAGALTAYFG